MCKLEEKTIYILSNKMCLYSFFSFFLQKIRLAFKVSELPVRKAKQRLEDKIDYTAASYTKIKKLKWDPAYWYSLQSNSTLSSFFLLRYLLFFQHLLAGKKIHAKVINEQVNETG